MLICLRTHRVHMRLVIIASTKSLCFSLYMEWKLKFWVYMDWKVKFLVEFFGFQDCAFFLEFVLLDEKLLQNAKASMWSIRKNSVGVLCLTFDVVIVMTESDLCKTRKDLRNHIQSKVNPGGCQSWISITLGSCVLAQYKIVYLYV